MSTIASHSPLNVPTTQSWMYAFHHQCQGRMIFFQLFM